MYAEEAKKYQIAMVECQKSNKAIVNHQIINGRKWSWRLHIGLVRLECNVECFSALFNVIY
jgi:hypothetical protein